MFITRYSMTAFLISCYIGNDYVSFSFLAGISSLVALKKKGWLREVWIVTNLATLIDFVKQLLFAIRLLVQARNVGEDAIGTVEAAKKKVF